MATEGNSSESESGEDDTWGPDPDQPYVDHREGADSVNSVPNMQLCVAVHDGDLNAVTFLVEAGANVNFIVENSASEDLRASVLATNDLDDQLKLLEEHCMSETRYRFKCPSLPRSLRDWERHFRFEFGHCTPLKVALMQERKEMVQRLLELGARPDVKHLDEDFIIFPALKTENCKLVEVLLRGGADPNVVDSQGCSPLHHMIHRQCVDILRVLLQHGASLELRSQKYMGPSHIFKPLNPQPLMLAAGLWENDHEMAVELVLAGADLEAELLGGRDFVDGMSCPLADPPDILSWTVDKIRACGVLTSLVRLLLQAGVTVRDAHVQRARYWADRVVRHTASRPGQRTAPPGRHEDTTSDLNDTMPDPNFEVRGMLEHARSTPSSLSAACRKSIRRRIFVNNGGRDIRKIISSMDMLPEVLRSYVAMETLTEECHIYSVGACSSIGSLPHPAAMDYAVMRALLGMT